jgi:hypothetical protein
MEVGTIAEPPGNIILFPTTTAYYERELTRHLEAERYEEAVNLLLFLQSCQGADSAKQEEWGALLNWLRTMFPETMLEPLQTDDDEEAEESESGYIRQYVEAKSSQNRTYGIQLIELLRTSASPERQLMILDQLAFAENGDIDVLLLDWLKTAELHPMVQFKLLQTFRRRGAKGIVQFVKLGEKIAVDLEETPAFYEQFPAPIRDIMSRVESISESDHPDFSYFAKQTWLEFLAYAYGTSTYRVLAVEGDGAIDAWAAALHRVLLEIVFGQADREELNDLYGITGDLVPVLDSAYEALSRFRRVMMPSLR